ncbi:LysR family transcriptional regulator [Dongia sp.]|uniref:LysR family transcriptional regulator n=1 Tax=Dongia sp. TaxID=1977262 RepID=UPI0035B35E28
MDRLDDLEAFLAIVESGSQTAAAHRLGRSLQAVSRSLIMLERGIGIELVRRTTRQSIPTEAGLAFYRRLRPALTEISEARAEAVDRRAEPSGLLRIGAPAAFAPAYVVPAINEVMERYPKIEIDLKVSDRKVDLVKEGLDLAIRIRELPDSQLKAKRLGELRVVTFGAASYFKRMGRPTHPEELAQHQCVLRTAEDRTSSWAFRVGEKSKKIPIHGRFRSDSAAAILAAVANGVGVGMLPLWQIRNLVDEGVVEVILEKYEGPRIPIYAIWPASKIRPTKVRILADALTRRIKLARL